MYNNFCVIEIKDSDLKSAYTKEILEQLPEWFGNKQALDEYVEVVKAYPFWAAVDDNNRCLGFFSIKIHYQHTGDIFVCGVHPEYHNLGIGKTLYSIP